MDTFHQVDLIVYLRPVLFVIGLAALCFVLYSAALPRPLPGIPYNKEAARHLLGDLPAVTKAKFRRPWVWNQPRQFGSAVSQVFFFPFRLRGPLVIVTDYREVVDILARRHREFDRGNTNKRIVGLVAPNFHLAMQSSDVRFKAHKELIRDLMTPTFLQKVAAPRVYDRASCLVSFWTLKMLKGQGRPFSASSDLHLSTLDTICSVAFGLDDDKAALKREMDHVQFSNPSVSRSVDDPVAFSRPPSDPEIEALLDIPLMMAVAQKSAVPTLAQYWALRKPTHARGWWYRRSLMRRQTNKSIEKLAGLDDEEKEARQESALDQLLVREMLAAKKAGRRPDLYSPAIRDELLGFLLGGHDTSAGVLSWWVKYMAVYQQVQERLRAALQDAHLAALEETRCPTMSEIVTTKIPYLDAVVEEALRFAGVATMIARVATCDTQILGHAIPKGTDIMLLLTGPSMNKPAIAVPESLRTPGCMAAKERVPAWEDDIGIFKPERWLRQERNVETGAVEEIFDGNAGPNLAFSTGPRQCFGKKLAYMQLRTFMTLLIWNFKFEPLDKAINGDITVENLINIPRDCFVKLSRV